MIVFLVKCPPHPKWTRSNHLIPLQDDSRCLHRCKETGTAQALGEFSLWEHLGEGEMKQKSQVASQCIHQMSHKDELTDDKKVILDQFSIHMQTKNKTYRRLETVKCSNRKCSKYQVPYSYENQYRISEVLWQMCENLSVLRLGRRTPCHPYGKSIKNSLLSPSFSI